MIYVITLTACYLAAFTAIYWLALARIERDYPPVREADAVSAYPPDLGKYRPLVKHPCPPAVNCNEAQRLISNMMYGKNQ